MKNSISIILLSFVCSIFAAFSQETTIKKFLGEGFVSVPSMNRGYSDLCTDCKLVFTQRRNVDTSGIVFKNEYVLFRNYTSDIATSKTFGYFHQKPVSNAEFQEFQNWVRDSMARELLYEGIEPDDDALMYITLPADYNKDERFNRGKLRKKSALNWKKEFDYYDPHIMPFLADFYLPPAERFYKKREFDTRKCVYKDNQKFSDGETLENKTTLITYPESFALEATSKYSETSVLAQLYELQYPDLPVLTYSSAQARAFCQWKEEQLQKEVNAKNPSYKVAVTLPLSSELNFIETSFVVLAKDYTENWKITVGEYQEFVNAVRDSIVLEQLYENIEDDDQASKMLNYDKYYYVDNQAEIVEFDASNRNLNRKLSSFMPISTVYKKNKYEIDSLRNHIPASELNFIYWSKDMAKMAIIGKTTYKDAPERRQEIFAIDSITGEAIGKTANLTNWNRHFHSNEALSNENFHIFFQRWSIENVIPTIALNQQNASEIVKGITYEQALAYYNWRFPIAKAGTTQNWQDYVFPTKEEFEAVQNGQSMLKAEHLIKFPVPTFHYVVQITKL